MKKHFAFAALISAAILFGGCSADNSNVAGYDAVMSVRKNAASADSGHYSVINNSTGISEQEFTYFYDKKNKLHYLCTGVSDGSEYREYYTGTDLYTEQNGALKSDNTVVYNRKSTHPFADGQLFFMLPECISDSRCDEADGETVYTYDYDTEKLADKFESLNGLTAISAEYRFDSDGNFADFVQNSTVTDNGKTTENSYTVTFDRVNEITDIPDPFREKQE